MAHPDDADFVCGGTVAYLTNSGVSVTYVVATDGNAGESHIPLHEAQLSTIRKQEQREAARTLGVDDVVFLDLEDGALTNDPELRQAMTIAIREHRPDVVITHAPDRNYGSIRFSHPDHLAAGQAVLSAVYPDSRSAKAFAAVPGVSRLKTHTVPEVWLFGADYHNHYVDITEHFHHKLRAVRCHRSQLDPARDNESFFRDWAAEVACQASMPAGRLAEMYRRLDTR